MTAVEIKAEIQWRKSQLRNKTSMMQRKLIGAEIEMLQSKLNSAVNRVDYVMLPDGGYAETKESHECRRTE